jgi:DNA-directed RNA polymerase specialized sigma24 family protein
MLEKLAENHKKWVQIAYNLCKCKDYAQDIVQDMYIKVIELEKEVDDGYIYFIIRSIFIDAKRKQKENVCDSISIDKIRTLNEYTTENEFNTELKRKCFEDGYKKLLQHERVIIHFSSNMGLREFARESGISISLIQKTKHKLKILVWQETKKYEELATLSQKLQKHLELKNATGVQGEKMF